MTLPVPLAVCVGDAHVTREVQSVSFRKEAVGGVRNIAFRLARPLSSLDNDLTPLTSVYVTDKRTAKVIAQGRLADPGRSADDNGEAWDVVAFGPIQHASDITGPLIYVDRSIADGWTQITIPPRNKPTIEVAPKPGDTSSIPTQGVLARFTEGEQLVASLPRAQAEYRRIYEAGQKLARFRYDWDTGLNDGNWVVQVITGTDGSSTTSVGNHPATTAGGSAAPVVISQWANGHNTVRLDWVWTGGSSNVAAEAWAWWGTIIIIAMRLNASGADVTSGYTTDSVLASEVVGDLLGRRFGDVYDGANAIVETTSHAIIHLAYPDGVTAEQVLEDLMKFEPAYRWYTTPDTTGGGYGFRWELWPTTARYEVTLDDGGSFPLSTQELYSEVSVRYQDIDGSTRTILRTMACQILDDAGITRRAMLDLGGEVGGLANATQIGDTFLAQHNVPKNAGSLTIARPIRDVITGGMVDPWEIEAGELVRVLGIEGYNDALNAVDNDGQTVFRIYAVEYNSDGNVATLALDSDPHDTTSALVKLLGERNRR